MVSPVLPYRSMCHLIANLPPASSSDGIPVHDILTTGIPDELSWMVLELD